MKNIFTLIACLICTSAFAQEKYNLSLGADFVIDYRQDEIHTGGIVLLKNNTATTTAGKIVGDFVGKPKSIKTNHAINGNKYWYKPAIFVKKNKLNIHGAEQEFCFTTNPIDVSKSKEIGYAIDFSGKGTLDETDPPSGKIWHDWIEVNYLVDGLGPNGDETKHGFINKIELQNIDVQNAKTFQIEICIRNTGHDEWYTIENIEITKTPDLEEEVVAVKEPIINKAHEIIETTLETEIINNSPTLSVFPNPTTNYLEVVNKEKYDLNSIHILDATGKLLNIINTYPLNVSALAAGTYFISVIDKETQKRVSTSFVVVKN